jgi:TPR repeat protein
MFCGACTDNFSTIGLELCPLCREPFDVTYEQTLVRLQNIVREQTAGRRTMFAHFELGTRFRCGKGAAPNLKKCVEHYRLSAELGYHRAYVSLGIRYQNGEGVPQDNVEGARLMKIAAIKGNSDGMHNLARSYSSGIGVQSNLYEAVRWWRAAVQVGPSSAHWDLGRYLYAGELPCTRHVSETFLGNCAL